MKKTVIMLSILTLLLSFSACKKGHTHTYAEKFSYDAAQHWRQASCEHAEEKSELGAHQFDGRQCTACGYQRGELRVRVSAENQKYTRTTPIHELLEVGFATSGTEDVRWMGATANNIESYVISGGTMTVTVSAAMDSVKYTADITVPLDDSFVDVEAFFAISEGETALLRGIVAGFSTTSDNNEVVLADKTTGRLVTVTNMGEGSVLHGGYSLPDIAVGDEIIIPVTSVCDVYAENSANFGKIYAEYVGGVEYKIAVVSENNAIRSADAPVVIENQADFESFLAADSRQHYTTVKLKGTLNFKLDGYYESYNFWFSDREASGSADIKIDGLIPCFNNPAVFYTTGVSFSELVFGTPHKSSLKYTEPLTAEVEITAVFLGGNTGYAQFFVQNRAAVVAG